MKFNHLFYPLGLLALVLFDSVQQYYYVTTFELSKEPVYMGRLLVAHLGRWGIWTALASSIFYLSRRFTSEAFFESMMLRGSLIIGVTILSIIAISIQTVFEQSLTFSYTVLTELFVFYTFQKGLAFSFAALILFFQIDARKKSKRLSEASQTIYELKETIRSGTDKIQYIQIRTGFKLQNIDISDIVWIQAEDYCSRVHTAQNSYVIRKSLKAFESELSGFPFIRIHRGALLNLNYLDEINLQKSTVMLKTQDEIPASKTGIRVLRGELNLQAS